MNRIVTGVLFLLALSVAAAAQTPQLVRQCVGTSGNCVPVSATNPLPIDGTISASLTGFEPSATGSRGAPLTVTTSDSTGTLPTGAVVIVSNVGTTNPMYCNVRGVAATVADQLITVNGGWFAFTIPAGITQLRCIATGGSTTANSLGGSGLPTGTGGGSGGGGGGAVTVADGADVTQGAIADAVVAAGAAGTESAKLRRLTTDMAAVLAAATTPLDNSSVAINVSTATTTQLVAISASTLIYVTSFDVIAGGTGNITFVYGTGASCGTGTTSLTGPYNLTAQAGISKGAGIGTVLKVPAGNALCVTTSAAVQMSGSVSYRQF